MARALAIPLPPLFLVCLFYVVYMTSSYECFPKIHAHHSQHAHPCDPGDRAQQPTELGESFVVEWPTISFFSLAPGSSLRYSDCCSV
uniref:Putative secreted peptide n=1 Tax=Anopheles braziliensis TaxID=58242 RepID=A0A2M3ZMN1_9DIPT